MSTSPVFKSSNIGESKSNESRSSLDSDADTFDGDWSPILRRTSSQSSIPYLDLSKLTFLNDFDFGIGKDVSETSKKKLKDMKTKAKRQFEKFTDDKKRNEEIIRLQERFLKRLSSFDKRLQNNLLSSATEKLFYALALFTIATSGFIIGKYPEYFHIFHTILFCLLMPIRFYTYFKQSFQYYLADLCYYVNVLLMIFIWWVPHSTSLFISVFALSMGTLSFAVITWRNSLVLHSIEKTTSSFIHIMPPITMFVIVHELPESYLKERFPAVFHTDKWNFINGILWTSFYYTAWQVTYHYFITIKRKEKIKNGLVTSFTYLKEKQKKSTLGKFVNSLPYTWMQITAFSIIQFGYQLMTMIFCPIWFKYKLACGSFVSFIFIWASYNGATFYIDVFGKRLDREVEKLKLEIADLKNVKEQEVLTGSM